MSIEYFVEGKVITKVKGDYSVFSKEDITHNTKVSLEQSGKEKGVSYNKAKTIHPNDKPIPLVNITLNLFFDGTLNNKTNVEAGVSYPASDGNDSFANDYSNIARGYDAIDSNAEMQITTYIEGIGSVDLKSDNDWTGNPLLGGGLGDYERGIPAKVTKGCLKSAKAISNKKRKLGSKPIDILTINVFGFSRGAAAARYFLHIASSPAKCMATDNGNIRIQSPYFYEESVEGEKTKEKEWFVLDKKYKDWIQKHGYFGACLAKNKIEVKRIVFKFAGLYDTVASFGFNHRGGKVVKNDTRQLGLTSVSKSYFTFQIAADDEYRDNFDLTNINSCGVKGLEVTLPGVHSDIGGGYKNGHEQSLDKYKYEISNIFKSSSKAECEEFKKILTEEGWFKPDGLTDGKSQKELSIYEVKNEILGYNFKTHYELRGKRMLSNQYDKIPLNQMFYYSQQFEVKYTAKKLDENIITDSFIQKVNNQLLQYIKICNQKRNVFVEDFNNGKPTANYLLTMKKINYKNYLSLTDLKILRNQYFHWSVDLTSLAMVPRVKKVEPIEKRKRNIQNG